MAQGSLDDGTRKSSVGSAESAESTLTTPQRVLRPRTVLPSMITLRSEPTTAKGIIFYPRDKRTMAGHPKVSTYPDALVELNLLLVILIRVEGVEADIVVVHLCPNLYDQSAIPLVTRLRPTDRTGNEPCP